MRKIEMKICKVCKKLYRWESGGIVKSPQDYADMGRCEQCRAKLKFIKKVPGTIEGGRNV